MIFISLPLYRNEYSTYTPPGITNPTITYLTCNVAHIACINDFNTDGTYCYVAIGTNSWAIGMTKERVMEEIKSALEAAGVTNTVISEPTITTQDLT